MVPPKTLISTKSAKEIATVVNLKVGKHVTKIQNSVELKNAPKENGVAWTIRIVVTVNVKRKVREINVHQMPANALKLTNYVKEVKVAAKSKTNV